MRQKGYEINMKYRKFGNFASVSPLGFGTMRLPEKNGRVDREKTSELLHTAIDCGVNYIDTAYFYHGGESEEAVGEALSNGYREKTMLATKAPLSAIKTADDFDRIFDIQMNRLKTDFLDCYLLHAVSGERWENTVKPLRLVEKMHRLRESGAVKHIGFSFHGSLEDFKRVADEYEGCEFCQIQLNYIDVNNQAGLEGLRYAAQKGMGVIIMEPLLGGKLANLHENVRKALVADKTDVEAALDFLWDKSEVSFLLSGMNSMQQLKDNLVYAGRSNVNMLSEKEKDRYIAAKAAYDNRSSVACTGCRYCMPCPAGIDIPALFSTVNEGLNKTFFAALEDYKNIPVRADACKACGACEKKCPQGLPVRSIMKEINQKFGE